MQKQSSSLTQFHIKMFRFNQNDVKKVWFGKKLETSVFIVIIQINCAP